jgi:hypothetical protein
MTTKLVLLLGVLGLLFPRRAYAYIDPGTGSYFLQIAVAGLLATSYAVKVYWRKILSALRSPFRKGSEDGDDGR